MPPSRTKETVVEINDKAAPTSDGQQAAVWLMVIGSILLAIVTFPLSAFVCIKHVMEYERAVVLRLGRLMQGGARGPGMFFILPCIDEFIKVDLRTVSMDVPPQEILTRDSVTVSVDAVVFYRVSNPVWSQTNVENVHMSTRLLAQTTLRNMLDLDVPTRPGAPLMNRNIPSERDRKTILDTVTDDWGIKVERVEIKDVRIPVNLQRSMAAEAEAQREAKGKVVAAEGELKASRALKEAADVIAREPAALQLRYLQTLGLVSATKNQTIIFPLPVKLVNKMFDTNL